MPDRKRTEAVDWDDLRYFAALARLGSLSAVARSLGVNHATVARRVARLEAHFGRALFDRRPEGYLPTAAAAMLLEDVGAMDRAAGSLLRRLDTVARIEGRVRVTATPNLADLLLAGPLGAFAAAHPGIEIELLGDSRNLKLGRREADLALRLARPRDGELLARKLGRLDYGWVGTADWAARAARGEVLSLVGYDESGAALPEARAIARRAAMGAPVAFRSNGPAAQRAAALAGAGVALLPQHLIDGIDGLVPIAVDEPPLSREIWLLVRRDLAKLARVRAVIDWVAAAVKDARGLLERV
ncbi:MAG: LysR family transcriptional regulator [Rhodospirillales bacterium]|nr:LysR family transcriptional regulator [Rhodospirillales bacterium]